jgi:hypothetical protein
MARVLQLREPPAAQVGDDSRWHLEEDEPGGEECVRGKSLSISESGVEEEERVDPQMDDAASV